MGVIDYGRGQGREEKGGCDEIKCVDRVILVLSPLGILYGRMCALTWGDCVR